MHLKTKFLFSFLFLFACFVSEAQNSDSTKETQLPEVVIKAFEQNRRLRDVPAAVNYIGRQNLERFSPSSIVMAVNTTPGVRMEERSPGSYRFNIRGSSLRSPFGVRNVKVYFNDIPITDPGGHTYLNQLGYYNFNSIEIVKGPGSSLYGAGTGGVLLIESMNVTEQPSAFAEYAMGSFSMQNVYGSVATGHEKWVSRVGFQHQKADGYRDHSELKRNVLSWNSSFKPDEKHQLKTTFLYGDLFYETPGALTLAEYNSNPKMARPGGFGFPGAEQAKASITQKTFLAGASYWQQFSSQWQNKTIAYGMFTELRNPTVRNYGRSSEPHAGVRTVFKFQQPFTNALFSWDVGGEWQQGFPSVSIHKNVGGNQDSLQSYDEINNRQYFVFTQASLDIKNWLVNAGASWNKLRVRLERFQPATLGKQTRNFTNEIAPRFSLARKLKNITIYSSVSKGFSPPTTAELTPSGGAINLDLNAEDGWNYDLGLKAGFQNGLYIDVNAFIFSLNNTIVQRRDAGGGDYFVNAGKTKQHGIETYISYPLLQSNAFMKKTLLWLSHTWHNFHYKSFKQLSNDFSGKALPAEAPHTISTGFDFMANNGLLGNVAYYFSDKIPLNDANTEYASDYHLLSAKLGYEKWLKQVMRIKIFAGVENLLDQKYSLGNDINGFGGRYYNAAAGRSYYASLVLQWNYKRQS
jgi:iron complex outermembrane recepter protein